MTKDSLWKMKSGRLALKREVFWPVPIIIAGVLACSPICVSAQTKCIDAKGKVTYSDKPCPSNTVQRTINMGGSGAPAQQSGEGNAGASPAVEKLAKEQRRLEWVIEGLESDFRMYGSNEDAQKIQSANFDLIRVKEQILEIVDPLGYQQYLKEKKERQRDQQLRETQRMASEASARAASAERSAQAANARAADAEYRADSASARAASAQQSALDANQAADSARRAAAAAQGAASRPMYCKGDHCYQH